MFYNGFDIADNNKIRTSVCIIGAGPAGITAAIELNRAGISVALVESGNLERDSDNQSLNIGNNTEADYQQGKCKTVCGWLISRTEIACIMASTPA